MDEEFVMYDKERLILKNYGWEFECCMPLELYHEESNSKATGIAGKLVIESVIKEYEDDERERIEKETKEKIMAPNIKIGHTLDPHNKCDICGSPLKINILRTEKCVNPNCKNFYHGKA
jgi:hypothetical protein